MREIARDRQEKNAATDEEVEEMLDDVWGDKR